MKGAKRTKAISKSKNINHKVNNNKAVSDNNIYSLLKVVEQSKAISKNVTHKVKNKIPLLSVEQAVLDFVAYSRGIPGEFPGNGGFPPNFLGNVLPKWFL